METNYTMVLEPCGSNVYVIYKLKKNVYCQEESRYTHMYDGSMHT